MVGVCPCKDCSRRCVGCHVGCVDYDTWKAAIKADRDKLKTDNALITLASAKTHHTSAVLSGRF